MKWIPVKSSTIYKIIYNEKESILGIEFISGKLYRFFDVPIEKFEGLKNAESKGKYFSNEIRNNYKFAKV